ncbi:MAG: LacI family DNA-binding transcriptional regulator [bacterium]|nr:LacI family DNA-binding transcriptional regulator [bacterium]
MAVTIKDIAKQAGVSYSTVSRALNNSDMVRDEKKEMILEIANKLGYFPNQAAINLKNQKANTIGLFFSEFGRITSPFVLHKSLIGMYEVVESKYNIIVKGIDSQTPGSLNPSNMDGILVISQKETDSIFIEEAIKKSIPVVVLNRPVYLGVSNVLTDETKGMKHAMLHLLENGHRNIGIIEAGSELASTRARHRGWVEAVQQYHLSENDFIVERGNYSFESGYNAAKYLIQSDDITAILCFNDDMAFGANQAIAEAGLHMPNDISLVGYDNLDINRVAELGLTTVERNMEKLAVEGTKLLLEKIEDGLVENERIYMETKLIVRSSVKNIG